MAEAAGTTQNKTNQAKPGKVNGKTQGKPGRVISNPNEVAQLVMMRIDQVNSKKDELTIAVKALADIRLALAQGQPLGSAKSTKSMGSDSIDS